MTGSGTDGFAAVAKVVVAIEKSRLRANGLRATWRVASDQASNDTWFVLCLKRGDASRHLITQIV